MNTKKSWFVNRGNTPRISPVGIIEVQQENDIPSDYFAGTSIGSIFGGMYATAISAYEIK